MKLVGKTSSYQNVMAFMTDELAESELTDHEKQLVTRWNEAWTLIRNYNTTADAVAIMMKRFPGLSRASAYRDCSNAISLFGDISKSTKEGIKHLATEMIRDGGNVARAKNNEDGMIKAGIAIARVNGVNVTDPDLPDFSKLEPNTYEFKLDPLTEKAIMHLIKSGRIDLTMIVEAMQEIAETVEFEEIKRELPK